MNDKSCDLMYFGTREAENYAGMAVSAFQLFVAAAWLLLRLRRLLFALARLARDVPSGLRALGRASSRLVQDLITVFRTVSTQKLSLEAERIAQEKERIRLRRSRIVMQRGVYFMIPLMVFGAASGLEATVLAPRSLVHSGYPKCGQACHHTWRYLFQSQAVPVSVLGAIMVLFDTWPSLVTARGLDYSNVLVYSIWLWKLAVQTSVDYEYNKYWITPIRILQCFIFGNARLTALLHVIAFFAEAAIRQNMVQDFLMLHLRTMSPFREGCITCGAVLVTWGLEVMLQAEAANVVTARTLNNAGQLVRQLLGRLCDAVVMLDADFRITQPCPALAAMLLRDGTRLVGKQVTELMPPEDAVRLRNLLAPQQDNDQASLTGLFHGSMSDGDSNQLPVEIFFSRLSEEDAQQKYLIGVQEQRDGETTIVPELAVRAPSVGRNTFPRDLCSLQEHAPSCSAVSRGSSECSKDDTTYVWVDAAVRGLPVMECSVSFAMLGGGQSPCSFLSEWMSDEDRRHLCDWLGQDNVRGHLRVRLEPTRYWCYSCNMVVCRTREAPVAAASAGAVCLLVQELRCKAAIQRNLREALKDEMQHEVASCKTGANMAGLFFVWVSSETGQIGGTTGDEAGVMNWAMQADLSSWVGETEKLSDSLKDFDIAAAFCHYTDEVLPYKLGNFTFDRPGACGPTLRFPVQITATRIRNEPGFPFPICLQFRQLEERTQEPHPGAGSTAPPTPRVTL